MKYRTESGYWFAIVMVEGVKWLAECDKEGYIVRDLGIVKKTSGLKKGCKPEITFYKPNLWGDINKRYPSIFVPLTPIVEIRRL